MFQEYSTGLYSIEEIRKMITNEGLRSKKNCKFSKTHSIMVIWNITAFFTNTFTQD